MVIDWMTLEARARAYAALGEPARLAIADMLSLGDASPGEIGTRLAMPTNLVAHHLGVLRDAGLIQRARSEGDARRTYVRLRHDAIPTLTRAPSVTARRVVFVCTHNSARSQLAAALWTRHSPVPATSAGTDPANGLHPRTLTVAERHGMNLAQARTAHLSDVTRDGDLVIAVCDNAHEHLPAVASDRLHWSVPDPAPADTDDAFEAAYTELATRIDRLAPAVTPRSSA
jgi:protein-tyrosine-phosphatase